MQRLFEISTRPDIALAIVIGVSLGLVIAAAITLKNYYRYKKR